MKLKCKKCGMSFAVDPHELNIHCGCGAYWETPYSEPIIPNNLTVRDILASPCKHQLPLLELRECKGCRGMVKIKVNGCGKHVECTIDSKFTSIKACTWCEDYETNHPS